MKSLLITLTAFAFTVAVAQAQTPPPTPVQSATPSESSPSDTSLTGGTVINATLNSSVDSKKAKPGLQVIAQTTEPVKSNDGRTVLPKGTKLTGHVTQASARDKDQGQATLAIQFDKAKLKDGQEMALTNLKIQALAAPVPESSPSSFGSSPAPVAGSAGSPANNPSMSGSRGARPEGTPTTPSVPPSTPNTQSYPDASPNAPAGAAVGSSGPLPQNAKGVYGLEGVRLNPASTADGTLLTSTGKNIHLDSGTRLLLVVQPQNGAGSPGR